MQKRPKSLVNMFLVSDLLKFCFQIMHFLDFCIDLRTFIAKICRCDLHEQQNPQSCLVFGCMSVAIRSKHSIDTVVRICDNWDNRDSQLKIPDMIGANCSNPSF